MKNKDKKYYKLINIVCDAGSLLSLIISFIYTVKFFTAGTKEFEMLIMLSLSVIFELVKILLVISENKKFLVNCLMMLFITISILFTMNAFLNKVEVEKMKTKTINPEFEKNNKKIENKKIEIENKKTEIDKNKDLKIKAVNGINPNLATKRIETAELYQKEVTIKEKEMEKLQSEMNVFLDLKVEKYIYTDVNNSAINTKILDFIFQNKIDQKTKNLIICIFFALLIDFTHLTLSVVKKQSTNKFLKLEELEKLEMKKQEEIKNNEAKEAKKKEIIQSVRTKEENYNVINLKEKKEDIPNRTLSEIADKILTLTIENNSEVPPYRDLVKHFDVSMSVIQRRVAELKETNLIYRVPGTKKLKLTSLFENKESKEV